MNNSQWYSETAEEKRIRELEEARERMAGFTMKASDIPPNRPKPLRAQMSIWDKIEMRLSVRRFGINLINHTEPKRPGSNDPS